MIPWPDYLLQPPFKEALATLYKYSTWGFLSHNSKLLWTHEKAVPATPTWALLALLDCTVSNQGLSTRSVAAPHFLLKNGLFPRNTQFSLNLQRNHCTLACLPGIARFVSPPSSVYTCISCLRKSWPVIGTCTLPSRRRQTVCQAMKKCSVSCEWWSMLVTPAFCEAGTGGSLNFQDSRGYTEQKGRKKSIGLGRMSEEVEQ